MALPLQPYLKLENCSFKIFTTTQVLSTMQPVKLTPRMTTFTALDHHHQI